MRKARMLLILFAIACGASLVMLVRTGLLERTPAPDGTAPPVTDVLTAPDGQSAQERKETAKKRPTFDIVRAEPNGSMVLAGQALPGWTVVVQSNGKEVGRAKADDFGEWVITPDKRLAKGEHSLELRAIAPDGNRSLFSTQRLALSLSDDPQAGQPLVALTEEGKGTRVLQMPAASAREPGSAETVALRSQDGQASAPAADAETVAKVAGLIGFSSVDYEDAGSKSMLFMNGHARPDARIALFVNNKPVGTVATDATGRWSFSGNRWLPAGPNLLRADLLGDEQKAQKTPRTEQNTVIARAEVTFERPNETAATLASGNDKLAAYQRGLAETGPQLNDAVEAEQQEPRVVVIREGDTLWQIAERFYGDGAKYTQIFRNNRSQIRDPDWIYPDQRVNLP